MKFGLTPALLALIFFLLSAEARSATEELVFAFEPFELVRARGLELHQRF